MFYTSNKDQASAAILRKLALFLLAFSIVLTGCSKQSAQKKETSPTREVTDDLGRKVNIPLKVSRAISLAPNLTENIFAVGAGDKLVGVTTFCDYPAEAKSIQKVGDTINPNMESVIALKPQIVFVSTASQMEAFTKTLEGEWDRGFCYGPEQSRCDLSKSGAVRRNFRNAGPGGTGNG